MVTTFEIPSARKMNEIPEIMSDERSPVLSCPGEVGFIGKEFVSQFTRGDKIESLPAQIDGETLMEVVIMIEANRQALDCHYSFISSGSVSQV